jgi:hypothetical protein
MANANPARPGSRARRPDSRSVRASRANPKTIRRNGALAITLSMVLATEPSGAVAAIVARVASSR